MLPKVEVAPIPRDRLATIRSASPGWRKLGRRRSRRDMASTASTIGRPGRSGSGFHLESPTGERAARATVGTAGKSVTDEVSKGCDGELQPPADLHELQA